MPWVTSVEFEFKTARGKVVSGKFDHLTKGEFPDLADNPEDVLAILERQTHEIVWELGDLHTVSHRVDFKQELKDKGWKMKDVAARWKITPRHVSNIAKTPSLRDWDAIDGLPEYNEDIMEIG